MTDITTGARQKSKTRNRQIFYHPKTDLTPMVDLGFLLISFFVITTELSRPRTAELAMPKDGPGTKLGESDALTVLATSNKLLFYYHGDWDIASKTGQVVKTSLSDNGLRKVILEKQQSLDKINKREGRKGMMLLIKPGPEAEYGSVVDLLDEALINGIKKYAVVRPEPEETGWLLQRKYEKKGL